MTPLPQHVSILSRSHQRVAALVSVAVTVAMLAGNAGLARHSTAVAMQPSGLAVTGDAVTGFWG